MRYIHKDELLTRLRIGKSIEQFLSANNLKDYTVLKWLWLGKERDESYTVNYVECFDDGDENYIDIYAFSSLDPDEPYAINTFDSPEEAVVFAISYYHASETRFLSTCMLEDEYKEYLKTRL